MISAATSVQACAGAEGAMSDELEAAGAAATAGLAAGAVDQASDAARGMGRARIAMRT